MNLKDDILELVSQNKIKEALAKLRALNGDNDFNSSIAVLSARYKKWESMHYTGQGTSNEELAKIAHSICYYAGEFEGSVEAQTIKKKLTHQPKKQIWPIVSIILGITAISLFSFNSSLKGKYENLKVKYEQVFADAKTIQPGKEWSCTKLDSFNLAEIEVRSRYFRYHDIVDKKILFIISKDGEITPYNDLESITISDPYKIPKPGGDNMIYKIKCDPQKPSMNVGETVFISAYLIPTSFDPKKYKTPGELKAGGALSLFYYKTPLLSN